MIEELIPGNKTKFRMIETIYKSSGINITTLIKKVKASPNLVLKYVNTLSENNIIKEERIGGKKKIHIRTIKVNLQNETARILYSLIEINKKQDFFKKYKQLRSIFLQLEDLISNKTDFLIIYGSFARFAATKDSDLDLLIIGKLKKEDITRIKEAFIALDNELSLKIETKSSFIKNKDKSLYQNILKEHIVLYGVHSFLDMLNRISSKL